ncbi:MAG TPA: PAS domain S-box protein [Candidatus Acidoferrales bacterium]|nr:PAS domain S-box protein [Candidatus Acidoferrales bacterium]
MKRPPSRKKSQHSPAATGLRRLAELRLKSRPAKAASAWIDDDNLRQLHELEVHQIELEIQNAELQKVREELEVALENSTDLYDFSPAGYVSLDESGTILEANLTGAVLLGLERSRLLNRRLPLLLAPASQPVFLAFLKKIFTGNKHLDCEVQLPKPGKAVAWLGFRATPAVSLKGAQKWSRVAFADITARKLAEEAMSASEERFRALFELGPVAIYSCDADGIIQDFNPRAAELWGRKPVLQGAAKESFCGSFKLLRPDGSLLPHGQCPMAEVLRGKKSQVRDAEVILERQDGSQVNCIVNIRPLKQAGGRITGAINCFYDITERKRAEEARQRADVLTIVNQKLEREITQRLTEEKSLKQAEQHKSELLEQSRVTQDQLRHLSRQILHAQEEERKRISRELHDVIAQTLTGINIRLAALKKEVGNDNKGFDRSVTRTQELVEKSVEIVHQFARELRPAVLDDLGLIPALHTFLKGFTAESGIHAHLTAFAQVEQLSTDRRTVLFRVAQESLTNVAKHAKAGRVEVNIQKLGDGVCMKIKDDGKSFPAAQALKAKGRKRLGLLGMRERLEMHGGSFEIESAPGQGTTVIATIPFGKTAGGGTGNGARLNKILLLL